MTSNQATDGPQVRHDAAHHRFETLVDGVVGELDYRIDGGQMVITHTGVPDAIGGRGIGGELVTAAVDFARSEDLSVVTECWYARRWLDRHPEALDSVSQIRP